MGKVMELTKDELRKMQLLQLDMLVELDRVCRKHDIKYTIFTGTLLGAVRHKGYIPWDDDSDVAMLREEYKKFKKVANELNKNICWLQDHETDPEYLWGYSKLRRTGTVYVRAGQEHMKFKTGVGIDIFLLDDVPKNFIGQMLQEFHAFCLRKILWSRVAKKGKFRIMRLWYQLISHIPVETVWKQFNWYANKSRNTSPNLVKVLGMKTIGKLYVKNPIKERYGMPKRWFLERAEYDFEGKKLYGPKDYDEVLKYIYKDYMTLPPESERKSHTPVSKYSF